MFEALGPWPSLAGRAESPPPVPPLEEVDLHFVRAAEGWLELGDPVEANDELDQIRFERRGHPDVLVLRWHIYAAAKMWRVCLIIARILTERNPDDSRGWLALAETFYFMKRFENAYTIAFSMSLEFPESWLLLYATARYACLLGRKTEAEQYLQLAMAVGDRKSIRRRALEDSDLAGLWMTPPSPRRRRQRSKG